MFMNDNQNDYFYPMGNTVVVLERPKEWITPRKEGTAVVHPNMVRLIDQLRLKRPTWRFKSTERVYGVDDQKLCCFFVYDGNEELGRIWFETHWRTNETQYFCTNHRIEKKLERRSAKMSTKLNVAVRNVLDSFSAKSLPELAADAYKDIRNAIVNASSHANYVYGQAERKALSALTNYIIDNWETLRPIAVQAGAPDGDLPALRRDKCSADAMYMAVYNGLGVNVVAHGDQFLMWRKDGPIELVSLDRLNDKQRGALGILKMVDDKTVIPDVGCRASATQFFLLD